MMPLNLDPLQPCSQELQKFIEAGTEVPKEEMVKRCMWKVSWYLMYVLKYFQYRYVRKDENGNVYLL